MDGVVVAFRDGGPKAGKLMEVRYSNGTTRRFLHLDGVHDSIKPGSQFKAGQAIAFAGNSGNASTKGTNRAVIHVDGTAGPPIPVGSRK